MGDATCPDCGKRNGPDVWEDRNGLMYVECINCGAHLGYVD